ncbi:MAG: hypothetical protein IID15_04270, partial [Candidatus Marinimicrobia bacterium]|nr:hypothetical protein [Candidatus Neomarinimicrobiota bacterium]
MDLDHIRDADTGEIEEWALDVVRKLDSYTEISPSGTGIHVLLLGVKPGDACKRGNVEIYSKARYATMTGSHLAGPPESLQERTGELAEVYYQYLDTPSDVRERPTSDTSAVSDLDDQGVIERAKNWKDGGKFAALWKGDTTGY